MQDAVDNMHAKINQSLLINSDGIPTLKLFICNPKVANKRTLL